MRTATTLAAASLALAITPLCFAPPPTKAQAPEVIKPKLTKVVESRVLDVVPPDENAFSFDSPELECTFEIALPSGMRIAEIIQPTLFTATDSTGKSIVRPETTNGFATQKVELEHMWEDDSTQSMTINLAPPNRSATTFTLKTKFNAVVFAGTKDTPVTITNAEAPLPDAVFSTAEPITAQLAVEAGQSTITFKPGAVRGLIESITVDGMESSSSMWTDDFVTYYLDANVDASAECTIKVRQNAASVPVLISVVDQPLP